MSIAQSSGRNRISTSMIELLAVSLRRTARGPLQVSLAGLLIISFESVAVNAATVKLFGTAGNGNFYAIAPSTGVTTVIGATNSFVPGMDFRSSNGVLYGTSNRLQTINVRTGLASNIATLPELMDSIAFSPNDQLFAINNGSTRTLYTLDPVTGAALSSVAITGTVHFDGSPFPGEISGIAFGPNGTLYGIGYGLYSINQLNGVATRITPSGTNVSGGNPSQLFLDLDYGSDGVLRGITSVSPSPHSLLYTINPSSGLGTLVGSTGFSFGGLASIPVPEPTTLLLVAVGGPIVFTSCRRHRYGLKNRESISAFPRAM